MGQARPLITVRLLGHSNLSNREGQARPMITVRLLGQCDLLNRIGQVRPLITVRLLGHSDFDTEQDGSGQTTDLGPFVGTV